MVGTPSRKVLCVFATVVVEVCSLTTATPVQGLKDF
jgi:hypothetical protein